MKQFPIVALSFLALGSVFSMAQAQNPPRLQIPPRIQVPPRIQIAPLAAEPLTFNPTVVGRLRPNFPINALISVKSPSILKARGAQRLQLLNQDVAVQGFYYEGSVPMVVDDIERTQMDMVMPPESYIPLSNRILALRNGDQVEITGRLVAPPANLNLLEEPNVLQIQAANPTVIRKIADAAPKWSRLVTRIQINPLILKSLSEGVETKYAVLIIGGANSANNHQRYWNDLKVMYGILKSRGYKAANITVIYADGIAKDGSTPVNYSASKANIRTAFKNLGAKLDGNDDLYVMLNDHGGGFLTQQVGDHGPGSYGAVLDPTNTVGAPIKESTYNADLNSDGDKNDTVHFHSTLSLWGERMTDDEFRDALAQVNSAKRTTVQMKQCFSGGFTLRLPQNNRVVMSSAGPNELSWSHSSGNYGAFTYAYFTALMGRTPDTNAGANANNNGDGMVSVVEAWNFARANSSAAGAETGLYTDTGGAPMAGGMPTGGMGNFGGSFSP